MPADEIVRDRETDDAEYLGRFVCEKLHEESGGLVGSREVSVGVGDIEVWAGAVFETQFADSQKASFLPIGGRFDVTELRAFVWCHHATGFVVSVARNAVRCLHEWSW